METQYDSVYDTLSKINSKKGVGKLLRELETAMQRMVYLVDLERKKDPQSEKIPYFLKIKSFIGQEVYAQDDKDGSKHEGIFCISADERGEFKEILLKQERKDENGKTFIYTLNISTTEGSAPSILPLEEKRNFVNIEKNSSGQGSSAPSSLPFEENRNFVNIEKISSGEDTRTTLMIQGIPRRYTSQMLLDEINKNHQGNYDYFYLPVNKRKTHNASYAFINMISPLEIIPFYQDFNGRKWDKFDGKEVASLEYAKTQGKDAHLEDYYRRAPNLMERDQQFRPIVFSKGQEQDNIIPQKMGEEEQQKEI